MFPDFVGFRNFRERACLIVRVARWKHVLTIFTNGLEQREGAKFSDENAQNELYKKQQSSVKKIIVFSAIFLRERTVLQFQYSLAAACRTKVVSRVVCSSQKSFLEHIFFSLTSSE